MKKNKSNYKNRYIVTIGEMCSQEILDQKTGNVIYGNESEIINKLIKELNNLENELNQKINNPPTK
jgi:hypothetical protein